jgi:hypothetical protein
MAKLTGKAWRPPRRPNFDFPLAANLLSLSLFLRSQLTARRGGGVTATYICVKGGESEKGGLVAPCTAAERRSGEDGAKIGQGNAFSWGRRLQLGPIRH